MHPRGRKQQQQQHCRHRCGLCGQHYDWMRARRGVPVLLCGHGALRLVSGCGSGRSAGGEGGVRSQLVVPVDYLCSMLATLISLAGVCDSRNVVAAELMGRRTTNCRHASAEACMLAIAPSVGGSVQHYR